MIWTSRQCAKRPFAGHNTQQILSSQLGMGACSCQEGCQSVSNIGKSGSHLKTCWGDEILSLGI